MAKASSFWFSTKGVCALAFIAAVSYFLLMEHRQHVFQFLPYLILLACPLMHIFMHRGHGGHNHVHNQGDNTNDDYQRGFEDGRNHRSPSDRQ